LSPNQVRRDLFDIIGADIVKSECEMDLLMTFVMQAGEWCKKYQRPFLYIRGDWDVQSEIRWIYRIFSI